MEITEVRVFPVNEEKLKAYATITFDDCFVVRDLKVINGNSGLFVAMPSKKRRDGTFKDVAHPLNNEFRSVIENAVLDAYEGKPADDSASGESTPEVQAGSSANAETESQETSESSEASQEEETEAS